MVDGGEQAGDLIFATDDVIGRAALAGALEIEKFPVATQGGEEEYQEAIQSTDTESKDISGIHVVGEIVAAAAGKISRDAGVERDMLQEEPREHVKDTVSQSAVEDLQPTVGVNVTGNGQINPTQSKPDSAIRKPKRQLAASFGSRHT